MERVVPAVNPTGGILKGARSERAGIFCGPKIPSNFSSFLKNCIPKKALASRRLERSERSAVAGCAFPKRISSSCWKNPTTAFTRSKRKQTRRNITPMSDACVGKYFRHFGKISRREIFLKELFRGNDFLGNRLSSGFPAKEGVPPTNPKFRGPGGPRGEGVPQGSSRTRRIFSRRTREIPAGNFVTRFRQKFSDDLEQLPQGVSRRDSSQPIPQGSSRTRVSFPADANNSRREFPFGKLPAGVSRRES